MVELEEMSVNVYGARPPEGDTPILPVVDPKQVMLLVVIPNTMAGGCVMVKLVVVGQLETSLTVAVKTPAQSEEPTDVVIAPGVQL